MTRSVYVRLLIFAAAAVGMVVSLKLSWPLVSHQLALKILEARIPAVSKTAPDFTLESSTGAKVHLSDFEGKVVLLNFWATWCGPCKTEIPWFAEFQNEFGPRGFTVLGIAMDDEGWPVIRPFMAAQKMNYPVLLGDATVSAQYGEVEALPTTFVIGRDGRIAYLHRGLIDKPKYRAEILRLLNPG
jgi:peroxiredoxin